MITRRKLLKIRRRHRPCPRRARPFRPRHRAGRQDPHRLCQPAVRARWPALPKATPTTSKASLPPKPGANFEVIVKDSQSNPNRAAEVAKELIVDDEINLMLVASTPETTNPVATTCEAEGMPVISTMAPWQPWFIGQQGNPGDPACWKPFNYAFHYLLGAGGRDRRLHRTCGTRSRPTRWSAACSPTTATATPGAIRTWASAPALRQQGYTLTDPGRYQNLTDDFTRPDQRLQGGERRDRHRRGDPARLHHLPEPGACSRASTRRSSPSAKAILFPQSVEALGEAGHNLSSEVWWSPQPSRSNPR